MPSHLSRLVFRVLLAGRPLTHQHCVRLLRANTWPTQVTGRPTAFTATRDLFNWGEKKKQVPLAQGKRLAPGHTELARLDELLRMNVRPLEAETVNRALSAFFTHKLKTSAPVTDGQLHLVLVAFKHLQELEEKNFRLSASELISGLKVLRRRAGKDNRQEVLELAQLLYDSIRGEKARVESQDSQSFGRTVILPYVEILCSCEKARDARDILQAHLQDDAEGFRDGKFWEPVLRAFIEQKDDAEMSRTLKVMEHHGIVRGQDLQLSVLDAFARRGDFVAAQEVYNVLLKEFPNHTFAANQIFLDLCIKQKRLIEGEAASRRVLEKEPSKKIWDLILRWAAAKGKGVDEVERMMEVMIKRNQDAASNGIRPDADTINGLIQQANLMGDPYQAERFMALADRRGIPLNGNTYALQMSYRLDVGDPAGAYKAFQTMLSYEVEENADLPQINRLIRTLSAAPDSPPDAIDELLTVLRERRADYEPATVAALVRARLQQDQIRALIELLHAHAYNLSSAERRPILDEFLHYIGDRTHSVKESWDAYCIAREIFAAELDPAARTRIMVDYFARGRSDVAVHVFGHMRQAEIAADRPKAATYALCFQGVGHAADERSFDLLYNMLKLDSEIEPDTQLRNAIMLAQIGCGFRSRALEVWEDIVFSREGPSYNSIAIALYAVETTRKRTSKGQDIWARLASYGVKPTAQIYVAYIGACAGQNRMEEALQLVREMPTAVDAPVDATTLGVLYNAAFAEERPEVVRFAESHFADAWAELQALGTTDAGLYRINRQLTP